MTAAVANYPGSQEIGTPPSRRCPTPPSGLIFGGRPVATPMGLAALWEQKEKEPVSHSVPAPPGRPRWQVQAPWPHISGSPKKSGPLLIMAEAPMQPMLTQQQTQQQTHTPRTRFDSPSPLRDLPRPVSTSRPSVTPSRLGFPDPPLERAASPVRHASPAVPSLPRRRKETGASKQLQNEDLIHQHVLYVLRKNPDVARLRRVQQVTQGVYLIDGQEVNIEWRHSPEPGQRGYPIVVDGPMRQPLIDYLRDNEERKEFDLDVVCTTALHQVPKDRRMTFDDKHKQYSRLEAMKVAKEQASIREQAADYTLDGKQVPDDLVRRYNKALRAKVRSSRSKEDRAIIAQEKQDLAPLHAAQVKVEPVKTERIEVAKASEVAHVAPVRQASPSPAAMRMAAQAMAVVNPDLPRATPEAVGQPVPMVSVMSHRGISLNGIPSHMPSSWQPPVLRVTRSWSGAGLEPATPEGSAASGASTPPSSAVVPVGSYRPMAVRAPMAQVVTTPSAPAPPAPLLARRQISMTYVPGLAVPAEAAQVMTPAPAPQPSR